MDKTLFNRYAPVIRNLSQTELTGAPSLYEKLALAEDANLSVCYVPFEYVNPEARVVIVGITPGRQQLLNAVRELRRQLDMNVTDDKALMAAKATGAFSGTMRPNLIGMLDAIGIQQWLGLNSCTELFTTAGHLVQTTSVLRNPVFVDGENYNGAPNMTKTPFLRKQMETYFATEAAALPNAIFIPLGDKVAEALQYLSKQGFLDGSRILEGLPHPSGANAERIAYFLGRKARDTLSAKTNPDKLDDARTHLRKHVLTLA